MDSEKDRFGSKLQDVEKAREDQFFAQRDRELLERLRQGAAPAGACPNCGQALEPREESALRFRVCPGGHGAWIAAEDAARLREPAAAATLERACAPVAPRT
jgi:DNA repair exonuclease SbcCD ATPase subunit